ncbi:MAG: hypothetical protein E6I28_12195 [Chloroflexi bacterium]|nr:MAG: hypothetical protein E6I28_12195 [Chloroflexota bacterium]
MSSKNLEKVIQRAISDAAFRRQLQSNPAAALRGFKLTDDEVAALRSGDAGKLMSLGIDQRMSKTFSAGDAMALNTASRAGALDVSVAGLSVAEQDMPRAASDIDAGAFRSSNAVIDPGNVSSNAVIDPGNVGGRDALVGDPTGHARVIRDIDPNDIRGDANDNLAASAAGRAGSLGTGGDSFRSAVRDVAPADLGGSQAATDEGQSTMGDRVITQAAGGETVRAVRDIAPNELRSATYSGDDASGPGYLASDNDAGSVSRIRDAEPYDSRGAADPTSELTARHLQGADPTSELTARHLADADASSVSRIRDMEPFDSRSAADPTSELTARHMADTDAGSVSRIRDAEPFDSRSAADPTSELTARHMANTDAGSLARTQDAPFGPDPDSAEAYSPSFHSGGQQDAFLSSGEAASYAGGASVTEDQVSDSVQALTPPLDVTNVIQTHDAGGDAIGNTPSDPEITA